MFLLSLKLCYGQESTHRLNDYLQTAKQNSPVLKDYQNQINSGTVDSLLIRASDKPNVSANGQVAWYPTINGYGYDRVVMDDAHYAALLSASQPLFNKSILAPQYQKIAIQNQALYNRKKLTKLGLHKKITAQYLAAYAAQRQLQYNKAIYKLLLRQKNSLKKLVQNGIYKESDYLTFLTTLQSQEITVNQLQTSYKYNLSQLNYLCGIRDTSVVHLAQPQISLYLPVQQDRSVFLRQYQIDSLRIQNQKDLLDVQYKPKINWFAGAGFNSSRLASAYHYFGVGFGLNLSIPIYDGKQRKLKYQQFKITEKTRENYVSYRQQQQAQQRAMLQQKLNATQQLIQTIQQKLKTVQLLIKADKKLLNTGNLQLTGYLLAIKNYLSIQNNLNQAQINRYQIINQLNYWNH